VPLEAPRSWQLGNTAINRLLFTDDGGFGLVGWGDTGHLDGAVHDEFSDAAPGEPLARATDRLGRVT
jgi:probable phosphoglycerate mutase